MENWNERIKRIEHLAATTELTQRQIKVGTVVYPEQFVKAHLEIVKARNGNARYIMYLERLEQYFGISQQI